MFKEDKLNFRFSLTTFSECIHLSFSIAKTLTEHFHKFLYCEQE